MPGYFGAYFGGAGAASTPPVPTGTTTAEAIRDRAIAVIAALVPATLAANKFVAYRNEGDADFTKWAESNPAGALRRFQVRTRGTDRPVEVSNTDYEVHYLELEVRVAYPQTARAGKQWALDRDDAMDQDCYQIETAIGLLGGANFVAPNPSATWREGSHDREVHSACDFLVIRQVMSYARTML